MKTPERALAEYAGDLVDCFHGHRATWRDFEVCCRILRIHNFGIYPCFWKILRHKGLDEDKINALNAVVRLFKTELVTQALKYGHILSTLVEEKYSRFFNPHRLLLYESLEEVNRDMPSIEKDIEEVVPDDEPLRVAKKCYEEYYGTRILCLKCHASERNILKTSNGKIDLVTIERGGVQKNYIMPIDVFLEYLSVLSGRKVKNLEVRDGQALNFDAAPASFRVILADGTRCNLLLYSLVTFECLGI